MNISCPKCGKPWDEDEIQSQICNECGSSGSQTNSQVNEKKHPIHYTETTESVEKIYATKRNKKYSICPICTKPWTWNEIGYQSCNNCEYENSKVASRIQFERFSRIVLKYIVAAIVAVFAGTLVSYGKGNQALGLLIASITKIVIIIYFIVRHFIRIKTYPSK